MNTGIYQAIANALNDITPIAKTKRNTQQGFAYRGIDEVMSELSPILAKHRIFIYPEVIDKVREERQTKSGGNLIYAILTIKYHFAHEDGSEIICTVIGEGQDSGDKASNKAMAVAFKYACLQMFCIPTDDMDDPDKTTPPNSTPKQQTTPPEPKPQNKPNQKPNQLTERDKIIGRIGVIMTSIDPDKMPYFTDEEKARERATAGKADINGLKNQLARLEKDFAERQEGFKAIPFDDSAEQQGKTGNTAGNGEADIF